MILLFQETQVKNIYYKLPDLLLEKISKNDLADRLLRDKPFPR